MSVELRVLIELIGDDRSLLDDLMEHGIVRRDVHDLDEAEVEAALVARTLLRELDVNMPGVEIILRMRAELIAQRRQVAELITRLKRKT